MRELLTQNRLVTLTGAGGAGKTRLAIEVAGQLSGEFGRFLTGFGMWISRRSPTPMSVPITVARAFGLPDQPGRSTMDTLLRFVRRPSDAGGAGQLRASAGCQRRRWSSRCWVPRRG